MYAATPRTRLRNARPDDRKPCTSQASRRRAKVLICRSSSHLVGRHHSGSKERGICQWFQESVGLYHIRSHELGHRPDNFTDYFSDYLYGSFYRFISSQRVLHPKPFVGYYILLQCIVENHYTILYELFE
mgnify:CR=1 FL=1